MSPQDVIVIKFNWDCELMLTDSKGKYNFSPYLDIALDEILGENRSTDSLYQSPEIQIDGVTVRLTTTDIEFILDTQNSTSKNTCAILMKSFGKYVGANVSEELAEIIISQGSTRDSIPFITGFRNADPSNPERVNFRVEGGSATSTPRRGP